MISDDFARRNVERLVERNRQSARAVTGAEAIETIHSLGIVGAGLMGAEIAAACVRCGLRVVATDSQPDALRTFPARVAAELAEPQPGAAEAAADLVARRVEPTTDPGLVAACDVVLESVPEKPRAKQQVYGSIEPRLAPAAILATNTSTLPIGPLAAKLADPGRFCGIHFCHPVRRRPLVEVIAGSNTRPETVARAFAFAQRIGQMPLSVADGPGFAVNRLLAPYVNGAVELLGLGAPIAQIDRAMLDFGMEMGPLRLVDEIGIDTSMHGGRTLRDAFPNRVLSSPLLLRVAESGRLGRKNGLGFYRYPPGLPHDAPGLDDPEDQAFIATRVASPRGFTDEEIVHRLLLPTVLEGARLVEERWLADVRDVDLAMLFGLGFPAARGGLIYWADTLGAARIVELLSPWSHLGELAQPTALLLEAARRGVGMYDLGPTG